MRPSQHSGHTFAIEQGEHHLPRGTRRKQEAANREEWLESMRHLMSTPSSALLLNREVLTATRRTNKYTLAFQYQVITVSAAEIIQRCQSFFLKCINRDHSTFGAKELQILWTSCPKYTAAAPNSHLCSCYIPLHQTIACLVVNAQARLS